MSSSRTHTQTEHRPSISGRDSPSQNPTIDDQIRGYRLSSRLRFEAQRRLPGRRRFRRNLESQLDPDAELDMSQFRRAQQVPAETLYQAGLTETNHRVYQHYSDEQILVTDGSQEELPFITNQSYEQLVRSGFQHLHIGLIMIRLYTLHRRNAGINALVVLRDTRWSDDRSIISSMEMDLSAETQLAYSAPDMMITINDFLNHIQLMVQTHGYEGWQGGESNLLLSRSLIGRISNTSHTNFRYNVQHVADHLASRGIRAIPGQVHTTEELRGRQWIIRPATSPTVQIPQTAQVRTRTDGSLAIKFGDYSSSAPQPRLATGQNDEEIIDEETALMVLCDQDSSSNDVEEDEDLEVLYLLASLPREGDLHQSKSPVKWDVYDDAEEDEWLNPFALEGGGSEVAFAAETNITENDNPEAIMDYPLLRNLEKTFSAISTADSRRPQEPMMGPPMYPPAIGTSRQQRELNVPEIRSRVNNFRGRFAHLHNERFNLPSAQAGQGAMLVLPEDVSQYSDVISRWESITLNLVNERNWTDNKSKVIYIENLLGEVEKKIWIQWRMAYPNEYEELINIADDP